MNKIFKNKESGFTLVELIVSLGLFTVVMMISTGALLSLSDTNEKVQSMRIAFDNLNLALESMSREIRMGTKYHCDVTVGTITSRRDCTSGASSMSFFSQNGEQITYQLTNNVIERKKDTVGPDAITAPEITINNLKFYVLDAATSNNNQPRVIISVGGTAGTKVTSDFNIQTTVTNRMPK
jgi:prepilin-type N-terminal cleavage/methylation domain-containing protein